MIVLCSLMITLLTGQRGIYEMSGIVVANDLESGKYLVDFERGFRKAGVSRRDTPEVIWVSRDQCVEISHDAR